MSAVVKTALSQIRPEIREGVLQILLEDHIHFIGVEGGKSGGIHDEGVVTQTVQLHMPGGVPPPAELFGHLAGGKPQLRRQTVENAALAHAGISGEGHQLALNQRPKFLHTAAGFGAGADNGETGVAVDAHQIHRRVKVALVNAQVNRHLLISRNGRHPVNEKRLRHRIDVGREYHQRVNVGDGGADEAVPPGQHLFHHALPPLHGNVHHVTGEGRAVFLSQNATGAAGDHRVSRLHVIKSADGTDDPPGTLFFHTQLNGTSLDW